MFAAVQIEGATTVEMVCAAAEAFSPRIEVRPSCVVLDVSGMTRLFGGAVEVGEALLGAMPGVRAVAVAPTCAGAAVLAASAPGLHVAETSEAMAVQLSTLPVAVLEGVMQASSGRTDTGRAGREVGGGGGRVRQALQRWGVTTLGALVALPAAQVRTRLGDAGVAWQRLARGLDEAPLVPRVAAPVFERALELEWPIEGREPLSFVLARLLDPLALELERADRGAVCVRTALHLTTRAVHVRALPLPAPLRDAKTLRTLVLLDLESHPPAAAIDRVHVRLDPTPARVLQHTLFEPAQPAPEQIATLIARLTAVMGEGRVGTPALADTWTPGAFRMKPCELGPLPPPQHTASSGLVSNAVHPANSPPPPAVSARHERGAGLVSEPPPPHAASGPVPSSASSGHMTAGSPHTPDLPIGFRRFRLPVPVRVRVHEGRPVHLLCDRPGIAGGSIVQASGPWRTSGAWWQAPAAVTDGQVPWDRDEWDIALADGTLSRLHVERAVGQWALDGLFD
jgi:protein ImuB